MSDTAAHSVAEIAKKPLYRVTGGDVGTAPAAVERVSRTCIRRSLLRPLHAK
jgi:hypothetical protein